MEKSTQEELTLVGNIKFQNTTPQTGIPAKFTISTIQGDKIVQGSPQMWANFANDLELSGIIVPNSAAELGAAGPLVEIRGFRKQLKDGNEIFWLTSDTKLVKPHPIKKREQKQAEKEEKKAETFKRQFDISAPNFVNLFEVTVLGNPKVYSRKSESMLFFDDGDTQIGTVHDNPAYLRQYALRKARKVAENLQISKWNEQNGPTKVGGVDYFLSVRTKTIGMTERILAVLNFYMTPIQRCLQLQGIIAKVIYNGRIYKVETHNLNVSEQTFTTKGTQKSVFDHFKEQGIALKEDERILVCKLKDRALYFPQSLCWRYLPVDKGIKDQAKRYPYQKEILSKFHQGIYTEEVIYNETELSQLQMCNSQVKQTRQEREFVCYAQKGLVNQEIKFGQKTLTINQFDDFEQLEAYFRAQSKEKIALVVLRGKKMNGTWENREDYVKVKSIGHKTEVVVQCCLFSSLTNPIVSQVLQKKAESKLRPVKTVSKEVLVIAIDVWHGKGRQSIVGVHVRVHGSKVCQLSIAESQDEGQELLTQAQITKIFNRIFNWIRSQSINLGTYQVVIERDYFHQFENQEVPIIKQTEFYRQSTNCSFILIDKRTGIAGPNHERAGRFIEDNLFVFFGKKGTRPLLYKYLHGKGKIFTNQESVQFVGDETSLHFHFGQMKIGVTHKNADEVASFAALIKVNSYAQATSFC